MKKFSALAVALLMLGTSSGIMWRLPEDPLRKLIAARQRLIDGAGAVKPNQAMVMQQQAAEMQKMIDAAKAGETLDPEEVDRIVAKSLKPPY